jgi:hypothetical protein
MSERTMYDPQVIESHGHLYQRPEVQYPEV